MFRYLITLMVLVNFIHCAPQNDEPLFTLKNGRIGVNFGGYKASAGLGGLLTGNAADGGLYANAETPNGQRATAGGGGSTNGKNGLFGGLFAGAQSGYGQRASAGLAGRSGNQDSTGVLFAGADSGYGSSAKTGLAGSTGNDVDQALGNFLSQFFGH